MKLSEKKGGAFKSHPETEDYIRAVIVDITPLKKRMTAFGEKEEFRLVIETEVTDEENENRRYCIWTRGYTPSLDVKSAIRKDLKKMMGRELTSAELAEFDTETLIGMGLKIEVVHAHKDDQTYANISTMKPDKVALKPSGKYKRIKDRDDAVQDDDDAPQSVTASKTQSAAVLDWGSVVVHVGRYKGKTLDEIGETDQAGVVALIEKWLPNAIAAGNTEDAALIAALKEVAALLAGGEDDIKF